MTDVFDGNVPSTIVECTAGEEQIVDVDYIDNISFYDCETSSSDSDDSHFDSSSEDVELEDIVCWIEKNVSTFVNDESTSYVREAKRLRRGKVDLWETSLGKLLSSPNIKNVESFEGKKFRYLFRVSFQLFQGELVPLCRSIFDVGRQSYIPVEFKVLISLRLLGTDDMLLNMEALSSISKVTVFNYFRDFVTGFSRLQKYKIQKVPHIMKLQEVSNTNSRFGFPGCCGSKDVIDFRWGVLQDDSLSVEAIVDNSGSVIYISILYDGTKDQEDILRNDCFRTESLCGVLSEVRYTLYNIKGLPVACKGGYILVKEEDKKILSVTCSEVEDSDNECVNCLNNVGYVMQRNVESVFQTMNHRWRVLTSSYFQLSSQDFAQDTIYACCILSNMCVPYDCLDKINWDEVDPNIDDEDIYVRDINPVVNEAYSEDVILNNSNTPKEYFSNDMLHYEYLRRDVFLSFEHQYLNNLLCWPKNISEQLKLLSQKLHMNVEKEIAAIYVKESTIKNAVKNNKEVVSYSGDGSVSHVGDCGEWIYCTRLMRYIKITKI